MPEPRDDPNGYFLSSGLIPPGLEWKFAPSPMKLAYWKEVGRLGLIAKDADSASGLDRRGQQLRPIAPATRVARLEPDYSPMGRANPNAPPLTPCYEKSRTRSLLKFKAYPDGVAFYWDYDVHTGGSWGIYLGYHRDSGRDVIGLSPNSTRRVKRQALAWWQQRINRAVGIQRPTVKVSRQDLPTPTPRQNKRAPITPYTTGWRVYRDGKLETSVIPVGTHFDFMVGVRVAGPKRKGK